MGKINLMQLLCPARHCTTGIAYNPKKTNEAQAEQKIRDGMKALNAEYRCFVCGSTELKFESANTKYDSSAELVPHLVAVQKDNIQARQHIAETRRMAANN